MVVFVCAVIILGADPFFYLYWGQKANFSFIQFLGKENAGVSSVETIHYLYFIVFAGILGLIYAKHWSKLLQPPKKSNLGLSLVLVAFSFLLIRGGWSIVPINISSAFYSSNSLYNNTALNPVWNLLATEIERDKHKAIQFFDSAEVAEGIWSHRNIKSDSLHHMIKSSSKPNVVLIVLESFSAKVSKELSNSHNATPYLDRELRSGISYTNAYASSFRSDKGLMAIITGVPSGARQTLTSFPDAIARQPSIFNMFAEDYETSFYYGGDMEFANMKVLFNDADIVMSEKELKSDVSGPWGSHDEVVFEQFFSDFEAANNPQFKMLFSLSSHEPFDVPSQQRFEDPYLNSISYTDSCFGVLMTKLRKSEKWNNTIVIVTADHGTIRPEFSANQDPQNFRIPMVITGGLITGDTTISTVVSQTDIAATLNDLTQSNIDFPRQQSLLVPSGRAFYSYFDGITLVRDSCIQQYDFSRKEYIVPQCTDALEKAYYHLANEAFFTP